MLSSEQLAYIAGIVDGEGCIGLTRMKQTRIVMRVSVAMTDKIIPEWLDAEFGGTLSVRNTRPGWKTRYDWNIYSQKALVFLKQVLPFLVIKKGQAELAITFQEARVPHIRLSNFQKELDGILYETCKTLNARGEAIA